MLKAATILGILGGLLGLAGALLIVAVGGMASAFGGLATQGDPNVGGIFEVVGGSFQIIGYALMAVPILAIVGAAMVRRKPIVGGTLLAASALAVGLVFGIDGLNAPFVLLTGSAAILAFAGSRKVRFPAAAA